MRRVVPPRLSAAIEGRIAEALRVGQRAPFAAARVLSHIIRLAQVGEALKGPSTLGYMTRPQLAAYLDVSLSEPDKVLNQYIANGMLTERAERVPGPSGPLVRITFYDPSAELRGLIEPLLQRTQAPVSRVRSSQR